MWNLILALVLILLLLLLLCAPITVHISYVFNTSTVFDTPGTGVSMSFLWGLLKLRLRRSTFKLVLDRFVPVIKVRAGLAKRSGDVIARDKTSLGVDKVLDKHKQVLHVYHSIKPAGRYMLSTISLHRFSWCTQIGMWQAEQTGVAVGLLWAIKSNSIAHLYRLLKKPLPKPELEIIPAFDMRAAINTHLDCVFSFRGGHLLIAGGMSARLYLKNRKKYMHNRGRKG